MSEKTFSGREFRCEDRPASETIHLAFRLGKMAAPLLKSMGDGFSFASLAGQVKGMGTDVALTAIADFLMSIDARDAQIMLIDLAECAEMKGPSGSYNPVIFDDVFSGKHISDSIQVAAWVVQTTLMDFIDGVGAKASAKPKAR